VLDGHGGEQVARFCERHLPSEIAGRPNEDMETALVNAFHRMDELLVSPDGHQELQALSHSALSVWGQREVHPERVGSTAVVCCVRPDAYVVANAGDSRAVLCRRGRAIDLSEDHKPNVPSERSRIQKAGGFITERDVGLPSPVYRVNGDLSISRAIGDLRHKQNAHAAPQDQVIISTPDVKVVRRDVGDEFAVLACDGIWDVLSSQQAVDFLRPQVACVLEGKLSPASAVESLLDFCLTPDPAKTKGIGSDNMTVVLVVFGGAVGTIHGPTEHDDASCSSLCGQVAICSPFR
jgi:protein phosphatase 1G